MAQRVTLTPEVETQLRAEYEAATCGNDLAGRMGLHPATCRRLCIEAGLPYPKPAWSAHRALNGPHTAPTAEAPEDAVAEDVRVDRAKAESGHYKALYNTAKREIRAQEDLWDAMVDAYAHPLPAPVFTQPAPASSSRRPRRDAILQLSDWHVGQLVTPEESGGAGRYDFATFNRYLDRMLHAVVGSIRNQQASYTIDRLIVAFCGDMVEGHDIFNGQVYHVEMNAMEQVIAGADAFGRFIMALREALGAGVEVIALCVPGNHGKPGGRRGGATPATYNFDWLFYRWLKREVEAAGLSAFVIEPGGKLMFETAGHTFLMFHGQEVKGWGGFPYYGLDKVDGRLLRETGQHFDFMLLAHFHQAAIIPAGKGHRIVNGSAVGANQLTEAAVLLSTMPEQNLLFISPEHGLAEVAYLYLDSEARSRKRHVHLFPSNAA